ncbi:MAG: Sporulation integral membrane protein YtvI [Thermoanaerobacterales bacterium 50_218]|nr:MAG: Sporulation integral membrane protein YtvI [Thermoanaerobacterales bacterium 50_218]HAA90279.1 sporulation integral membrane protein YtvI [Peptococcaceae bacterium]
MSSDLEKCLLIFLKMLTVLLLGAGIYFFLTVFWPMCASLLRAGISAFLPFLVAFCIASILDPMITFLQTKIGLSRGWGTFLALIIFLITVGGLLFLLVSNLIEELVKLSQELASYSEEIRNWNLDLFIEEFRLFLLNLQVPPDFVQEAVGNVWKIFDFLKGAIGVILTRVFYFTTYLPRYFVLIVITFVATFFWARDYHLINASILKFIPEQWRESFLRVVGRLMSTLWGFLRAEFFLVTLTGFQSLIGLMILQVGYAHLLALLVALLDVLPVVGPGLLYLPWGVWAFISGKPGFGLGLLLLYGIIVLVRQFLEPKVIGQSIGLHPLTALAAIYFGLSILGVWGVVLGPAAVIVYKAFFEGEKKEK